MGLIIKGAPIPRAPAFFLWFSPTWKNLSTSLSLSCEVMFKLRGSGQKPWQHSMMTHMKVFSSMGQLSHECRYTKYSSPIRSIWWIPYSWFLLGVSVADLFLDLFVLVIFVYRLGSHGINITIKTYHLEDYLFWLTFSFEKSQIQVSNERTPFYLLYIYWDVHGT